MEVVISGNNEGGFGASKTGQGKMGEMGEKGEEKSIEKMKLKSKETEMGMGNNNVFDANK